MKVPVAERLQLFVLLALNVNSVVDPGGARGKMDPPLGYFEIGQEKLWPPETGLIDFIFLIPSPPPAAAGSATVSKNIHCLNKY